MNKSGRRLVNPDFFKQQNDEVQVFVGKRPTTSYIASSSIKLQQGQTRSSTSTITEDKKQQQNKPKQISTKTISRKEPIAPQQQESLYEMTRYLNRQTREDSLNDDSFQLEDSEPRFFRPPREQTLLVDDLEDTYNKSDTSEQEEDSYQDQNTPQSIHESPIKKPLPYHRRSLSARMLPNMGRGFTNTRKDESEEESPIKEVMRADMSQKRKPPRYPASFIKNSIEEDTSTTTNEIRKLQEEIRSLSGEVNFLKRDKTEQTKLHNEKIRSLQDRHTEEIQNQQKRFENLLENKENRINELQRENERLREQLGVSDKSKDCQDTNKLLNELENNRKSIAQIENEKIVCMDQIEKLKYDISEYSRQLKEQEVKIRNKEETINGLTNKIETQEREIKNLRERESKEINEREKALSMYTESDKANQQLLEKLKNIEFQSKQIIRESEIMSQKCNSLETTKVQLEKTNDQLRAKLQMLDEETNHLSQEHAILHQDREQYQTHKQRTQQELDNYRREISNLRDNINILKNEKSYANFQNEHSSFSIDDNPSNYSSYQQNTNYNRKNSNISLSSYSTQGLFGKDSIASSFNNHPTGSREPTKTMYEHNTWDFPQSQQNQNNRYQTEIIKESSVIENPKQSATTAKVMSIINRESPKERQHNRNKVMGTSYTLTPFAVDDTFSNSQTANIDEQLIQLSLEKTKLEGDMQKLFSMGIKSIAAKKQKMSLELRLEEIDKQSSQLKMRLRNMNNQF